VIDILYLAKGRSEFTEASAGALLSNTDWGSVKSVHVYFDGGSRNEPGARFVLKSPSETYFFYEPFGGPVAVMNDFLRNGGSPIFAKIDNDVIVPPGWLERCLDVMEAHPELGLLGIEPPSSTVRLDLSRRHGTYAEADSIGGVGLMRRSAFAGRDPMRPHSTYGGFTDWQLAHPEVKKGWICPPLNVFLLDRLPMEPWAGLSRKYIAGGEQRPWANYGPEDSALWDWWAPSA
jgi:hypothetical protein